MLLVTAMTAAAELSGETEILFPEMAAVSAGALVFPEFAWNVSPLRMLLMLFCGAVTGTLIVRFVPLPFAAQLCLAFLAASVLLLCSRTSFAPVISAVVLPVMMQKGSAVYPAAALLLTAAVIAARCAAERKKLLMPVQFEKMPMPDRRDTARLLLNWCFGCFVILFAVRSGQRMIAAPPLLVAYTEFCRPGSRAQRQPLRISLMIALCALTGALLRYAAVTLGVFAFPAAGLAYAFVLAMMSDTGLFLPPAAALTLLAFLVPERALLLYPVQVLAGALFFTGLAAVHGRARLSRNHG